MATNSHGSTAARNRELRRLIDHALLRATENVDLAWLLHCCRMNSSRLEQKLGAALIAVLEAEGADGLTLSHREICVKFDLGGKPFELVGYLDQEEDRLLGGVALHRADNGRLVTQAEDWNHICAFAHDIPKIPGNEQIVSSFIRSPASPLHPACLKHNDNGTFTVQSALDRNGSWGWGTLVIRHGEE